MFRAKKYIAVILRKENGVHTKIGEKRITERTTTFSFEGCTFPVSLNVAYKDGNKNILFYEFPEISAKEKFAPKPKPEEITENPKEKGKKKRRKNISMKTTENGKMIDFVEHDIPVSVRSLDIYIAKNIVVGFLAILKGALDKVGLSGKLAGYIVCLALGGFAGYVVAMTTGQVTPQAIALTEMFKNWFVQVI